MQELEGKKSSKNLFRVLEFLSKIPNIKKISNEHFNLCEAEISLDEIIKLKWNHKILKQIINLQLMMALQQNFSSLYLHPALSTSTQLSATSSTLIEPKYCT